MEPEASREAARTGGTAAGAPSFLGRPAVVWGVVAAAGSMAPAAPGASFIAAAFWVLVWRRRVGALLGALVLFVVCGVRSEAATRAYRAAWQKQAALHAGLHRCAVRGIVETSPVGRTELGPRPTIAQAFTLRVLAGDCEGRPIEPGLFVSIAGADHEATRGEEVEAVADLGPTRLFRNAALPSPFPAAARRGAVLAGSAHAVHSLRAGGGFPAAIDRARHAVRARIVATYPPLAAALARALVLGENDLSDEDAQAFSRSGLLHLLAVSGTHLVIAVLALVKGLRGLLVRIGPLARRYDVARLSSIVGALLSLIYADFAGGSGSAWRAAFMLSLVLGARALGRKVRGGTALGGSVLGMLIFDPLAGFDISFLLSALATAGLIGLSRPGARLVIRGVFERAPLKQLMESLVATLAATLPCAPLLAVLDGHMTWAALFGNVVAGPLGELLALPACLLHAAAFWWPALEAGLAMVGAGALLAVRFVALASAGVTWAAFTVPAPGAYGLAALVLWACALPWGLARLSMWIQEGGGSRAWPSRIGGKRAGASVAAGMLGLALLSDARPAAARREEASLGTGRLSVTALDIDQGDALVIDFPDGRLALVDGGGFATGLPDTGRRVLLPYLRARGRDQVDLMVLSHAHPDHLLGLLTVAETLPVRELWLARPSDPGPGIRRLVSSVRRRGGVVRGTEELCRRQGPAAFRFGAATLEALVACEPLPPEFGENDASLVVKVALGRRAALLSGDIEAAGEARLLEHFPLAVKADLLKIPHHGSDTSSGEALLDAVSPNLAFVSSGVRNRFDHPRPSVLERLARRGIWTLRTDRQGSLTWTTDGQHASVRTFEYVPLLDRAL